jgi:hypothetical protein
VHGVERAHGLPQARRQYRVLHGGTNKYLDNLYEEYPFASSLTEPPLTPPTNAGATPGGTTPTSPAAPRPSGTAGQTLPCSAARAPSSSPPCSAVTAGQAPSDPAVQAAPSQQPRRYPVRGDH